MRKSGRASQLNTALHCACLLGHDATVAALLDAGADVNSYATRNVPCRRDKRGYTFKGLTGLMIAARWLHVDTVALLLARGADPNLAAARLLQKWTAIFRVARHHQSTMGGDLDDTVAALVRGGADPFKPEPYTAQGEPPDSARTAWDMASDHVKTVIAQTLHHELGAWQRCPDSLQQAIVAFVCH